MNRPTATSFAVAAEPGPANPERLALGLLLILVAGCDGGGSGWDGWSGEGNVWAPKPPTRPIAVELLPVTVLAEGDQPAIGNEGPKQIQVIRSETDFAGAWFDYTADDLPEIDFEREFVVIHDRGASDASICGPNGRLVGVAATSYDDSRTSYDDALTIVDFHISFAEANASCVEGVFPGRPFLIARIPGAGAWIAEPTTAYRYGEHQSRSLRVEPIASGARPVSGDHGPRRFVVINNADEFERIWHEYSDEPPPEVDFAKVTVVLSDQGDSELNTYSWRAAVWEITADLMDESIATIHYTWRQMCRESNLDVASVVPAGRIYRFVTISHPYDPLSGDVLISEEFHFASC